MVKDVIENEDGKVLKNFGFKEMLRETDIIEMGMQDLAANI